MAVTAMYRDGIAAGRGVRAGTGAPSALRVAPVPDATLAGAFLDAIERRGDRVALREKKYGLWRSISWRDYGKRVRAVAMGLRALGFRSGDRACIIGENCPEWLYADMGIMSLGGVSVGVYPTDSPAQLAYVAGNCGARFLFVENEEQLDKGLEARNRAPTLERIVVFDTEGLRHFEDPMVLSLADLMSIGEEEMRADPGRWEQEAAAVRPDDIAVLIYTSGTTGPPKGAMLSHRNAVFQVGCIDPVMPIGPDDEQLSFLPLCHIAERLLTVFRPIFNASVVSFAESPETMPENLREVGPTVFFAVPRLWEKFYSGVTIAVGDATRLQQWAYRAALAVGREAAERRQAGRPLDPRLRLLRWLAEATVLRRTKKLIGIHRARYVVTGAAPIAPDLIRWYFALGVDMREAYGMTETTGVATFPPVHERRIGTTGRALPGTEVRIGPGGEILVRGGHVFVGYYGTPEKTRGAMDADGWLHTGDVGVMDQDGYLRITDRMKDIIITAGGKNITPSEIENELKFSPYIADAVVIGDRRKYLTALVMIDHDNVAKYAQDRQVPFTNYASLCRAQEVVDLVQREIDKVNVKFARVEQVKRFRLIDVQLTPEDEELTPTMKLKRKYVNQKYQALIESMYQEE